MNLTAAQQAVVREVQEELARWAVGIGDRTPEQTRADALAFVQRLNALPLEDRVLAFALSQGVADGIDVVAWLEKISDVTWRVVEPDPEDEPGVWVNLVAHIVFRHPIEQVYFTATVG